MADDTAPVLQTPLRGGWIRHHKPENRSFSAAAWVDMTKPVTQRSWPGQAQALDQGYSTACGGYSGGAMVHANTARAVTKAERIKLYQDATRNDGVPGTDPPSATGTTTVAVLSTAKTRGWITEYRWAFDFEHALRAVSQLGAVMTGIDWYSGFYEVNRDGAIALGGTIVDGHLICVDTVVPNGNWRGGGYVEFWNSWGTRWGVNGRAKMSWALWKQLLAQGGEAGIGLRRAA